MFGVMTKTIPLKVDGFHLHGGITNVAEEARKKIEKLKKQEKEKGK